MSEVELGAHRIRVKYPPEKGKRAKWWETLARSIPVFKGGTTLGDVVLFRDQKDGTFHIVSAALIEGIQVQHEKIRYGGWLTRDFGDDRDEPIHKLRAKIEEAKEKRDESGG